MKSTLRSLARTVSFVLWMASIGCSVEPAGPTDASPTPAQAAPMASTQLASMQTTSAASPEPTGTPVEEHAARPLPPISGGTLLVMRDAITVVAADADRDSITLADLDAAAVIATLSLRVGDQPGRLVEDGAGRVHILLRGAGQLATVDVRGRAILGRRDVCGLPQGVAYDEASDLLHVACADGHLVSLPAGEGPKVRDLRIDADLRDVVLTPGRVFLSRFKSAELIELDAAGKLLSRRKPAPIPFPHEPENRTFEAAVAWRTLLAPDGRIAMVHQRAHAGQVELPAPGDARDATSPPGEPAYGGEGCDGIVQSAVTYMDTNRRLEGTSPANGPLIPRAVLPVDAALSPDGKWLAIAVAGRDMNDPAASVGALVMRMGASALPINTETQLCLSFESSEEGGTYPAGQVVGVAFQSDTRLVLQTRDPNRIRVADLADCIGCDVFTTDLDLQLAPVRQLGHDLFHADPGGGIACASCHPGGGDDGRNWLFSGLGPRRTQSLLMGIRDTLPLHWDGEFDQLSQLLDEVFVRRMGGDALSAEQAQAMGDWIERLEPYPRLRAADDAAALRGQQIFDSAEVGCASCHNGEKLTNNESHNVGTGDAYQVPSLVGVAQHEPFMHDGCARNLRERFEPRCGGDKHGNTAALSAAQIDDLLAYLESI